MRLVRRFLAEERAATAVEFALVVPLMILFLLGIIDVGRYIWNVNEVEKATQIGTRWAVATDMVPVDLYNYSFAISGGVPQGDAVPASKFPGVECSSSGGTASCTCAAGGTCDFGLTASQSAFQSVAGRMNQIYAGIGMDNVTIRYDHSGLGYAGDPGGSDVDPLVTVIVRDVTFTPIFLANTIGFDLPDLSYSLTMEDGKGSYSN